MLYRNFATAEAIDREYNLVQAVPDAGAIADGWAARSEDARAALDGALGVRYGPTRAEYVDIFPPAGAAGPSPAHVFIHGGYWRRFGARDFSFVARPLVARGAVVAVVNYALCPEVSVGEILRQCRAALAWVHDRIADYGGDPARISVSGHSAGGHLAAMALATDWPGVYGRPADLIKAAVPISGVFDLAPIPYTFVQPWVQLGWDEVRTLSPMNRIPPGNRAGDGRRRRRRNRRIRASEQGVARRALRRRPRGRLARNPRPPPFRHPRRTGVPGKRPVQGLRRGHRPVAPPLPNANTLSDPTPMRRPVARIAGRRLRRPAAPPYSRPR